MRSHRILIRRIVLRGDLDFCRNAKSQTVDLTWFFVERYSSISYYRVPRTWCALVQLKTRKCRCDNKISQWKSERFHIGNFYSHECSSSRFGRHVVVVAALVGPSIFRTYKNPNADDSKIASWWTGRREPVRIREWPVRSATINRTISFVLDVVAPSDKGRWRRISVF